MLLPLLPQILDHLRQGRFERSLAFITGIAGCMSALEVAEEHFKGSFGQKIMYTPIVCCLLVAFAAFATALAPAMAPYLRAASFLLLLDAAIGFGFHIRGIARKPGGWRRNVIFNLTMGPPLFAPLLLGICALLGLVAIQLAPEESTFPLRPEALATLRTWLVAGASVTALLNGFEALYSHYKSGFKARSQWIPIVLAPPLCLIAGLDLWFPTQLDDPLFAISCVAFGAGMVGAIFHVQGILRRPGGKHHLFYNFIYGPPPFAPLLFSASGFLGLLALSLGGN